MRVFLLMALVSFASASATVAGANAETRTASPAYAPMQIFAPLDGKVLRGEGAGPDGAPVVDFVRWDFILGGRAFQSTHKIEGHSYGGRTIYFYDEGAKKYIFHYFTTAGFHSTGEIMPADNGFIAVEKVIGQPQFAEVRSTFMVDGDVIRVTSVNVGKDGKASDENSFEYREIDEETRSSGVNLFFDEADALFGKRTQVKDAHDRYGDDE